MLLARLPFHNTGMPEQGGWYKSHSVIEKEFPDAISWGLDTPVQKAGNCHFYKKAGFTGIEDRVHSEKVILRIYEKTMK